MHVSAITLSLLMVASKRQTTYERMVSLVNTQIWWPKRVEVHRQQAWWQRHRSTKKGYHSRDATCKAQTQTENVTAGSRALAVQKPVSIDWSSEHRNESECIEKYDRSSPWTRESASNPSRRKGKVPGPNGLCYSVSEGNSKPA